MAIYTFFLSRGDETAATFEAFDLAGDDYAAEMAALVLTGHPSAAHVSIWQNDRALGQVNRSDVQYPQFARQA